MFTSWNIWYKFLLLILLWIPLLTEDDLRFSMLARYLATSFFNSSNVTLQKLYCSSKNIISSLINDLNITLSSSLNNLYSSLSDNILAIKWSFTLLCLGV